MRILLTGNQGYIGTILVPRLWVMGYDVVGLDSGLFRECTLRHVRDVPTIRKDIRDVEASDLDGIDAVIHLAGLSNDPLGDLSAPLTYADQSSGDRPAGRARQARRHPTVSLRLELQRLWRRRR